ncbi:Thioredoxin domain-containing protein, partial [Cephalotus follicularis]
VMVEFYASWCEHCQASAPEYAATATDLKSDVALANVDATEESDLAHKYGIQGFPAILFFFEGVHPACEVQRTKEAIVTRVKKKTGPSIIYNKLGKHLSGIDSLVIAKMDGTANEHPRAKVLIKCHNLLHFFFSSVHIVMYVAIQYFLKSFLRR